MWEFFWDLRIPCLSGDDREALDAPVRLEEVRQAVTALANQKSLGQDGQQKYIKAIENCYYQSC